MNTFLPFLCPSPQAIYSILPNVIQFLLVVPLAFQYLKNLLIVLDDTQFCCIYLAQLPHLFEVL